MAADADNLRIQQQINAAIAERGKLLSSQTSLISDQVELAVKFCKAMKCEDIDKISDRITEIRAGLESAGKAASDSNGNIDDLIDGLDQSAEKADRLASSTLSVEDALEAASKAADSFLGTLGEGLDSAFDMMSGLTGAAQGIGEAIFGIGQAILDIPLQVFDMMLNQAADLANASQEIRQAKEEVRKQFGDISKGFAKDVVAGGDSIAKGLSQAGTSVSQVFGMGPGGTAAAIRASLEMATALGPAVNLLGKNFGEAAGKLVVFQKGLGLSGEDMKAFVYASKSMGTDVNKDLEKVAKIADDMGDKFGMSSKDIARDLAFMTTQSAKFGRLTTEQMAAASVTVRSFGMELKDVVGIMDQFADFESAANNASKLAQAFGATIDPMKLMKEENPAKAFEYLRKQMLAAGQDASTMNRAQLKLLATQTGMDENMVKTAFSAKNVGKSYEQIQKEAEKSGKKQKSQQEIFEQLGRSIEKMTESLQHSGSFMQEFLSGFGEGVSRAGPMRQVLGDLAKALMAVRQIGRQVGDAFVKAFPGVKDMLGAMHNFFGGGSFTKMVKGFGDSIKEFFNDLNGDPMKAFEKFYDNIKKKFFDMLDSNSGPGKKFMEGAKKFIMALSGILAGAIKSLGEALAKGLKQLAEFIKNPEEAMKAAGQAGESFFTPIMKSMGEVLPKIGDALMELLSALFWKIAPKLAVVIGAVFAFSIGKAFILGAAQAVGGALVAGGVGLLKTGISKLMGSAIAPDKKEAEEGAKNSKSFGTAVSDFFIELSVALGQAKEGIAEAIKNMPSAKDVWNFSLKLSAVALALTPLLVTLTLLLPFAAGAAVTSMALQAVFEALVPIGEAIKKTKGIEWGDAFKALGLIGLFVLGLTAIVATAIFGFVVAMKNLPIESMADAGKIAMGLAVLSIITVATGGLAMVAIQVSKLDTKKALLGFGMVALVAIGVVGLAYASIGIIEALSSPELKMDPMKVLTGMLVLGGLVMAIAALTLTAALAGSIIGASAPVFFAGVGAVILVALGVYLLATQAVPGIVKAFDDMKMDNPTKVLVGMAVLGLLVGAIAVLTATAAVSGLIIAATGPAAILGFVAIAAVAVGITEYLAPSVVELLTHPAVSKIEPAKALAFAAMFALVLGAMAAITVAAAGIGMFVVGTLGMGGVAIAAGLKIIASALTVIKDYVPPIVDALLTAGEGLTGDEITSRAEAVGKILAGLGGLVSPIQAAVALSESSEGLFTGGDLAGVKGVFKVVKTFIVDIMGTAKEVVIALIEATSGLNEDQLKGVDAGGKVLGAVAQVVGSMTSVLSNIDFSGDPASIAAAGAIMKEAVPGLNSMLSNIGTQMKVVIDQVRTALSGISEADIKMLGPRLDMVGKIFGIIGDFSGLMKDNQITPDVAGATQVAGKFAGPMLDGFKAVMTKFINFIKDEEGGLKEVAIALNGFPAFDAKKVDSVVKLLRDSIDIATAFSDMTKSFEKNYVTAEGLDYSQRALTFATNFAKQASEELKGVELLPGKKIENIKGALSYIDEMISSYADVVNGLAEVDPAQMWKLNTMFSNVKSMKETIDGMGDLSQIQKKTEMIAASTQPIPGMVKNLRALSGMTDIDPNVVFDFMYGFLDASFRFQKNGGYAFFDYTLGRLGDMAVAMETFKDAYGEGLATFLGEAVADMRALDNILSKLEIDPIDVTIDKLANKLLIQRQDIEIQNKPININLTMNVSFKAEEFVKDIFKVAGSLSKKSNGTLDSFATELNKKPTPGGR
jgi:hypothetical protein